MKRLGYHERIGLSLLFWCFRNVTLVNLLAAVTLSTPILLISEYCSNGDLLEFMRRRFYSFHLNIFDPLSFFIILQKTVHVRTPK